VPRARDFIPDLVDDTHARRLTLVHGDYSPKNILVREDRLILLDHEVIHWGDPAFDVGFALTHLLSKARHLRNPRFIDAARRFWDVYLATSAAAGKGAWDPSIEQMSARHTLGCMLARVAGRSTLEYLNDDERARQEKVVVDAMSRDVVWTIAAVIDAMANEAIRA